MAPVWRHIQAGILGAFVALLPVVPAMASDSSITEILRGRYLTDASDCIACHTATKDKPFAGGRPIETPFGSIYAPNITPDPKTGIGAWSGEDFYRALHHGRRKDGSRLYPAFPYVNFTKFTREDVRAIHAYLNTLEPIHNERKENDLYWPLNYRFMLRFWNWLFFTPGTFVANPEKSAEWNRGAYLVEGAGHCGSCHTPKNYLGADITSRRFEGLRLQDWFAPKLTNAAKDGLGGWSVADVVEYLKTGRNKHSGATGLMAEVVANSTSKMLDSDLQAIAIYLKDHPDTQSVAVPPPERNVMTAGEAIYQDTCSACHQSEGQGVPRMFPPLAKNASVQAADPTTLIRIVLEGAQTVPTTAQPTPSSMPPFNWKLDDGEIAAVLTFIRGKWANSAAAVTADEVKALRRRLRQEVKQ